MRSLKEKLAALERSARGPRAAVPPEAEVPDAGMPAGPELAATDVREQAQPYPAAQASSRLEAALADLGFTPHTTALGPVWVRTLRYDALTRHGPHRLGALREMPLAPLARLIRPAVGAAPHPARWVFYDTETTGLGTGAGTFAFLHAVGWLEEDEFVLEQWLVADYTAEAALLAGLWRDRLAPAEVVVSFNGRAFDWPLLKSRMRLHRLHDDPARPQLDLLHPARRLWRSRLDRVSLQTVEAEVLGMRRTADLPGSEAPDRYFRFVEDPQAECLAPVLDHNASDVLTLVVLATEVAARMGAPTADSAAEFAAMGRWYDEWQVYDLADACFERAAQHPDADWQSLWLASLHWKRRREWHRAAAIWRELAQRYPGSVAPLVELAKWAEHQLRQWDEAERWTMEALARAERQVRERLRSVGAVRSSAHAPADIGGRAAVEADPLVRALRHRLARIRRKRADRQG